MKKIVFLFIITSCTNSIDNKNQIFQPSVIKYCEKIVLFGSKEICLPRLNEYTECYFDTRVKDRFDDAVEYNGKNTVLAVYLTDKIYQRINDTIEASIDDYYILFGNKKLANHNASQSEIKKLIGSESNKITNEQWNKIKNNIESRIESVDFKFDRPIEIEYYSINDNVRSVLTLQKINIKGNPIYKVSIMNVALLNNRLVWLCYYKNYENSTTIDYSKERNNSLLRLLLELN